LKKKKRGLTSCDIGVWGLQRPHPASGRRGGNRKLLRSPAGHLLTGGRPGVMEGGSGQKQSGAPWGAL